MTRHGTLFALGLALAIASGCSTIFAVRGEQRLADETCAVSGKVATEGPARGPLVVLLLARSGADYALVDYFVAAKPGAWILGVPAGTYWVAAFEDTDGNGIYEDEPFFRPDPARPLVLAPGQRIEGLDIAIPRAGRALRQGPVRLSDLRARASEEQQRKSLFATTAMGTITSLDDPRFAEDIAQQGMWKFYDFLVAGHAGIYFLEPYDPKRIPVLFVHGIAGTPRNFTHLIASLDRKRFQPWVLYYPSGGRLDVLVTWLDQLFTRLELALDVRKAVVIAHSMGGLVSRGFVLQHHQTSARDPIHTFVTISSPLGGMESAGKGVAKSPIVVRSWYGLAPGSPYLDGLFYEDPAQRTKRRRLPETLAYHMLFGFRGEDASDGVVSIASELRPEAQEEAQSIRGYDETHTSILDSKDVATHVNEILATVR